ncbi:uncharacterized protein LOC126749236 [Anthonomus grandis grandis]|uniref:uncharacterized protein LOC126749236 n=1 Tax=Anthonomus grandis grandis TaxID=2921223 RepID=UPI0021662A60|nr:uncharacterized protein LOC126749236 [Anthonomus grandis grandis]
MEINSENTDSGKATGSKKGGRGAKQRRTDAYRKAKNQETDDAIMAGIFARLKIQDPTAVPALPLAREIHPATVPVALHCVPDFVDRTWDTMEAIGTRPFAQLNTRENKDIFKKGVLILCEAKVCYAQRAHIDKPDEELPSKKLYTLEELQDLNNMASTLPYPLAILLECIGNTVSGKQIVTPLLAAIPGKDANLSGAMNYAPRVMILVLRVLRAGVPLNGEVHQVALALGSFPAVDWEEFEGVIVPPAIVGQAMLLDQDNMIKIISTIKSNATGIDESLIRHEHLNKEERRELFKLIRKFEKVLHKPGDKLTFSNQVKHKINTTDEIPVYTKSYRYPHILKQEIDNQIEQMLDDEMIRPSNSPWSSPVWIVPKKADVTGKKKWRIVIDYRKLNEKTIGDRYPIPNITDILDKLGRCNYFTTIDLASGFHQIEMDPESIPKTAFNVEHGHYEYVRMPFGLKNAPATFQRAMDNVLRGLLGKICLVYMDDIIIFSTSLQEHLNNLKLVFERLLSFNMKIQLDKCEFLKKDVEFLGHIITAEGVKPNPRKIEAIKNFKIPNTPKEIKSFLGLVGYYRKFIKDFAKITKPLTNCLKKNVKIIHDKAFRTAFNLCKNILTNDPILQYPDFHKPFVLTTDASEYAIGAILSQGPIGSDLPISYASRTLNSTECNYSTIEKELLAIVWATKYFRPYLFGRKFTIITDHKPLQWLFSIKEPNSKLVRWRLKLQEYEYTIQYKKGIHNSNADALSRPPREIHPMEIKKPPSTHMSATCDDNEADDQYLWHERIKHFFDNFQDQPNLFEKPQKKKETKKINIISQIIIPPPSLKKIKEPEQNKSKSPKPSTSHENDIILLEIPEKDGSETDTASLSIEKLPPERQEIVNNKKDNSETETVHTSKEDPILGAPYVNKSLNIFKNQIIFKWTAKEKPYVTKTTLFETKKRLIYFINKDPLTFDIQSLFKDYLPPDTYCLYFQNKELEPLILRIFQETFKNNAYKLVISNTLLEDVLNVDERKEIIERYHTTKTSHRGMTENIKNIKQRYYWPSLERDVIDYVNTCETCQKTKYDRHPYKVVYKPTPTGSRPLEHIYMDIYSISVWGMGHRKTTIERRFRDQERRREKEQEMDTSDGYTTDRSTKNSSSKSKRREAEREQPRKEIVDSPPPEGEKKTVPELEDQEINHARDPVNVFSSSCRPTTA